jgi:hypothetical protein
MRILAVEGLPQGALAAAAAFHAEFLPQAEAALSGDDLLLVFGPGDHTQRGWRLAVVQALARDFAPRRVNAIEGGDDAAREAAVAYVAGAAGLTGQVLALDSQGV